MANTRSRKLLQCGSCPRQVDAEEFQRGGGEAGEQVDTCRLCVVVSRLERVEQDNSALAKRVAELEGALSNELDERRAVERKLEAAERELKRTVFSQEKDEGLGPCNKAGARTEVTHGGGDRKGNSYSHVLKDSSSKPGEGQIGRKEQHVAADSAVIIAGDSNIKRSGPAVMERVAGDTRVHVGCFAGQTMKTVMAQAKGQLALSNKARNLVVIAAGLNDVLKGEEGKLGQEIEKGVKELRATAPNVLIAVCTVPEVTKQSVHTERAVLAANSEIARRSGELGFEVIDVNRVVSSIGHRQAFQWDGIHFSPRLGNKIGWRLGGRAVAFLGGPEKLRKAN